MSMPMDQDSTNLASDFDGQDSNNQAPLPWTLQHPHPADDGKKAVDDVIRGPTNLASDFDGQDSNNQAPLPETLQPPHPADNGKKVVDDAIRGSTCHQCRQGKRKTVVECQNMKKKKRCVLKYCDKCLWNRYGLNAKDEALVDWKCPKCRDACNCGPCMKRIGKEPTGKVGLSDIEMILKGTRSEISGKVALAQTLPAANMDGVMASSSEKKILTNKHEAQKEDSLTLTKVTHKKIEKKRVEKPKELEIPLPVGTLLTQVAEIDMEPKDVGNALQFIEFCHTFGERLGGKKGQVETILRDIKDGHNGLGRASTLVQFQIQLLSCIGNFQGESGLSLEDGKNFWLNALQRCAIDYGWTSKEVAETYFDTISSYEKFSSCEKLRILVCLCDKSLDTPYLHTLINNDNLKVSKNQKKKQAAGYFDEAAGKEKLSKEKSLDENQKTITENDGFPLSTDDHDVIVSEYMEVESARVDPDIVEELESACVDTDIVETTTLLIGYGQDSDFLRAQPVFIDAKGNVYWRLKGHNNSCLLYQDISGANEANTEEKWYTFNEADTDFLDKHFSLLQRKKRQRHRKAHVEPPNLQEDRTIATVMVDCEEDQTIAPMMVDCEEDQTIATVIVDCEDDQTIAPVMVHWEEDQTIAPVMVDCEVP